MVYAEYGDGNFLDFDEAAPFVSETEGLADEVDEASDLLSIVQSRAIKMALCGCCRFDVLTFCFAESFIQSVDIQSDGESEWGWMFRCRAGL